MTIKLNRKARRRYGRAMREGETVDGKSTKRRMLLNADPIFNEKHNNRGNKSLGRDPLDIIDARSRVTLVDGNVQLVPKRVRPGDPFKGLSRRERRKLKRR